MRHSLLGWLLLSLLAAFVPSASEATVPIPAGFDLSLNLFQKIIPS